MCFFFLSYVLFILLSYMYVVWKQGGPAPVLVKAEVPWSARRGNLSENDRVLKTVKGYCLV